MSILLDKEEIEEILAKCVYRDKFDRGWVEAKTIAKAEAKKLMGELRKCGRESLDYYSPDKPVKEWCIPWEVWQALQKEVENG